MGCLPGLLFLCHGSIVEQVSFRKHMVTHGERCEPQRLPHTLCSFLCGARRGRASTAHPLAGGDGSWESPSPGRTPHSLWLKLWAISASPLAPFSHGITKAMHNISVTWAEPWHLSIPWTTHSQSHQCQLPPPKSTSLCTGQVPMPSPAVPCRGGVRGNMASPHNRSCSAFKRRRP